MRAWVRAGIPLLTTCMLVGAHPAGAQTRAGAQPESASNASGATTSPAAQGPEADKKARDEAAERFQKGVAFYSEGDFQLALIEFERAHQLVPDFRVLYNIGQVAIQLGKFARARVALETYLQLGQGQLDPARLAGVEKDLDMLRGRTAFLEILGAPDGSEVLIDDLPQGVTPLETPLLLDAGQHRLVVRKPQYQDFTRWVTLAGAERLELTASLQPQAVANSLVDQRRPEPSTRPLEKEAKSRPWVTVGWVATGSLAAGAIATGVTGLVVAEELSRLRANPNPESAALQEKSSQASAWFLATDILGAAALVTGGVTLYFTIAGDGSAASAVSAGAANPSRVALQLGPQAIKLSGAF